MQQRMSAGAIVVDVHERVLLVRHRRPGRYDIWVAPGGGVQGRKLLVDAAVIVAADWLARDESAARVVFPMALVADFWRDRAAGFAAPRQLAPRVMEFERRVSKHEPMSP
jgi:hypothetical protein